MAETNRSLKPVWWALTLAAFVALAAWAYIGTKKNSQEIAQTTAVGATVGTAYDPTTGQTVPAGAVRGSLGTAGSLHPQAVPIPGPLAQGAEVPPAKLR